MHIRVATAVHPAGPFRDSGHILTSEPFAIDAHVFADDDGTRHLFYATDYLEHQYIGTGTARSKMIDPYTLERQSVPVTRAQHDWQVYDPNRAEKGGVRWHTIEGSFVLKHKRPFRLHNGQLRISWENHEICVIEGVTGSPEVGVFAKHTTVALDMIRVTSCAV